MANAAQLIRNALITETAKVAGIGAVSSQWQLFANERNLPAAYVILDSDDAERAPTRSKEVHAHFRIATVLQSENPQDIFDQLRADIENQIEDDPTLASPGGLNVIDAWVSGTSRFATAKTIAGMVHVRDIFVEVEYRHGRAAA